MLHSTLSLLLFAALTGGPTAHQAYLKASNTGEEDQFGFAVAFSGDTLVVGAPGEDSNASGVNGNENNNSLVRAGAAYVFVRNGATWSQQAYLKASNPGHGDQFGRSVAISGDTLVVGARYEDSGASGIDGDQGDNSVQLSGAVYVFVRQGTDWTQQAYIKASNPDVQDNFGEYVALSGDTLLVGAVGEASGATGVNGDESDNSATRSGAAYAFVRNGSTWSQEAYLKASNSEAMDQFSRGVALSGDTAVIGALSESSAATGVNGDESDNSSDRSGAAYVFVRSGTTWSQQAYLKASNTDVLDQFGSSVTIAGDTLVVGASSEDSSATGIDGDEADDSAVAAGAAYVFVRSGTSWSQEAYLKASNTETGDLFGSAASLSGDTLVVSARNEDSKATGVDGDEDDNSRQWAGAAYVFERSSGSWSQSAYLKASNTNARDYFGWSVALAGDTAVVGTPYEASGTTGVNGDDGDNSVEEAGAAYVFDLDPDELGARYCTPAVPNSSGQSGVTTVFGSATVFDDFLLLGANELPTDPNIGYFIMGTGMNTFTPPGSSGPICVAPGIKRYLGPVNNTSELGGGFVRVIGTSGSVSGSITPGSTWNFQAWHRDGMNPSNLTDAVTVVFN